MSREGERERDTGGGGGPWDGVSARTRQFLLLCLVIHDDLPVAISHQPPHDGQPHTKDIKSTTQTM